MQFAKQTGKLVVQGLLGLALAAGIALVPTQQASAAEQRGGPGQLSIVLEPQADTAARNDGVDSYKIVVVNQGGGDVKKVDVRLAFGAGYSLAAASFNQDDAWVTQKDNGAVNVRVEQLRGQNDTLVGTLRFHGPRDAAQNAVTAPATLAWKLDGKAYSLTSNQPAAGAMALTAANLGANRVSFSGAGFAPGEPVTFWYTTTAGVSTPLVLDGTTLLVEPAEKQDDDDEKVRYGAFLAANAQGAVTVSFDTTGMPAGAYTLAARGNWSGATAAAAFQAR